VTKLLSPAPMTSSSMENSTVCFNPITWIRPAAKGPTSPNSRMFNATAPDTIPAFQPNASCSGTISTPGAARTPTEARMTTNITPTTIQA
jgi:hypothetical protein